MIIPNFVVFEGGDGAGTSTQLAILKKRLQAIPSSFSYSIGFEPTNGQIGKLIRDALCGKVSFKPETVARLFAADRGEHLYSPGGVAEQAEAGTLVISDRYVPSSLVYQGLVCGDELPQLLNAAFPKPELILYFDIDPQLAMSRIAGRPTKDDFERLDFQLQVKARYERILPGYAGSETRLARIEAARPIEEVAAQVWSELEKLPIFKR